jgi:hypothetical protein
LCAALDLPSTTIPLVSRSSLCAANEGLPDIGRHVNPRNLGLPDDGPDVIQYSLVY